MRRVNIMRCPSRPRRSRGVSLIETMTAVAIGGVLLVQGLPALGDYLTNARLRSAGQLVLEQTLYAQNEAIRRNGIVRVALDGSQLQVLDTRPTTPTVLRTVQLPGSVAVDKPATIEFGSQGRPPTFGDSYAVPLGASGVSCDGDTHCPAVRVDAGGGVSLCADRNACL